MNERLTADQVLARIIRLYMGLPENRVVISNQNFMASEKDPHLYVTIAEQDSIPLGVKHEITDGVETSSVVKYETFAVEVVSRNREAYERKEEIVMALHSQTGLFLAEQHNMRFWKSGRILDLSSIEAASALSRYRVTIVSSSVAVKQTQADMYEHFRREKPAVK